VGLFLEGAYLSRCEGVHGGFRVARFLNWFLFVVGVAMPLPPVLGVWFGVVWGVVLLFGGVLWFVWVLFCY
jgi:hypothetical protein